MNADLSTFTSHITLRKINGLLSRDWGLVRQFGPDTLLQLFGNRRAAGPGKLQLQSQFVSRQHLVSKPRST